MRSIFVCIAVAMAWLTGAAQALTSVSVPSIQSLSICQFSSGGAFYTAQSPGPDAAVAETLAGDDHHLVFRVCRDLERNQHYFLREPRPNRNGVCRSVEREVFPGTAGDHIYIELSYQPGEHNGSITRKGWKHWPPDEWALRHYTPGKRSFAFVSDRPCPPGDDPQYLPVTNVTEDTLKAFQALWASVSTDPKAFDRRFAGISVTALQPVDDAERKSTIAQFREAVFAGKAKPWSLECRDDGCSALIGEFAFAFDTGPRGLEVKSLSVLLHV